MTNDLISLLGYSAGSPFAGNPYLDIHTPEGLIDMSSTPMDLIGIDNKGNKKIMKAGRKNPYSFEGDIVREIPAKLGGVEGFKWNKNSVQEGGNPFEKKRDILGFLFADEEEEDNTDIPTAPSTKETPTETPEEEDNAASEQESLALQVANEVDTDLADDDFRDGVPMTGNPYISKGKASPEALRTLQDFQPQGFTNLGILPSAQHHRQNPNSDHETGKAVDLGTSNIEKGNEAVTKLQTEAGARNIKYIIWNRKIWNPSKSNEWRPYNGKDPHDTHIHISFK